MLGKFAYVISMLRHLKDLGKTTYRVSCNGQLHEANWVVVSNAHFMGGVLYFVKMDISQATVEIMLFSAKSVVIFELSCRIILGKTHSHPDVRSCRRIHFR